MSTTASIQITGYTGSVLFYQESDGYPSFVLNHLPAWLTQASNESCNHADSFMEAYGAVVGGRGIEIGVDVDPLDNGEDADWVYLIDLSLRSLTVQWRQYAGDQRPVDPLCEMESILDAYKADIRCSIGRAVDAIRESGYTLTPAA